VLRVVFPAVIDHFVKITEQSVISRRFIATQALGLADRSSLMSAEPGKDLFGSQWGDLEGHDSAFHKRKAEQAVPRARAGGAKRARGRSYPSARGQGAAPRPSAAVQQYAQQQFGASPPLMQYAQPIQYYQQP
jgi:hypothetical protein